MLHLTYPPVPLCTWHCVFFHVLNAYLTAIITTPVPVTLLALAATLFVGLAWTIKSFRSRSRSSTELAPVSLVASSCNRSATTGVFLPPLPKPFVVNRTVYVPVIVVTKVVKKVVVRGPAPDLITIVKEVVKEATKVFVKVLVKEVIKVFVTALVKDIIKEIIKQIAVFVNAPKHVAVHASPELESPPVPLNAFLAAAITTPVPVIILLLAAPLFVGLAWTIKSFRSRSRSSARLLLSNRSNLELPPGAKRPALSQLDIVLSRPKDELASPKSPRSAAETSEGAPAPMVRPIAQVARPPALAALPLDFASISRSSCPRTRSHTACAETSKGAPAPSGRLPAHVARRHPALLSPSKSHTDPNLLPPTADAPYLEQYARALRMPRDHFEDAGHHRAAFIVVSLRRVRQSRRQHSFFPP